MNIIKSYNLGYIPFTKEVVFHPVPEMDNNWEVAAIEVAQEYTIQPLEAALLKCRLRKPDGSLVGPNTSFYGKVGANPIAARTDEFANVRLYVHNVFDEDRTIQRKETIGDAENIVDYDEVNLDDPDVNTNEMFAIMGVVSDGMKMSLRPNEGTNVFSLKQIIGNALDRAQLPDSVRAKYGELLWEFKDVISESKHDLGLSDTVVHKVHPEGQGALLHQAVPALTLGAAADHHQPQGVGPDRDRRTGPQPVQQPPLLRQEEGRARPQSRLGLPPPQREVTPGQVQHQVRGRVHQGGRLRPLQGLHHLGPYGGLLADATGPSRQAVDSVHGSRQGAVPVDHQPPWG
ncbi:unnamed protein product [Sphagnum tenellum]